MNPLKPVLIKSIQDLKPHQDVLVLGQRHWRFVDQQGRSFRFVIGGEEDKLLTDAEVHDFLTLGRIYRPVLTPLKIHNGPTHRGDCATGIASANQDHAPGATGPRPVLDELHQLKQQKDAAYLERNMVVSALARMAIQIGFKAVRTKTAIEGWSDDWHSCVYILFPGFQASWHYHDSQAYLFDWLPEESVTWDGHTTEEKYKNLHRFATSLPPDSDSSLQPSASTQGADQP